MRQGLAHEWGTRVFLPQPTRLDLNWLMSKAQLRVPAKFELRPVAVFALCLLTSSPSFAATNNAWNGNWRLDEAKSSLPDADFRVTLNSQGEYHIFTRDYSYSFRCNGKDYPSVGTSTIACLRANATSMDTVWKQNGRIVSISHKEVSPDGKTLKSTGTVIHTNGSKETKERDYIRMTKSAGLVGSWKDSNDLHRVAKVLLTSVTGSVLRVSFPELKQYTDINLDGRDSPMHGTPNGVKGTLSATQTGPLRVLIVKKLDGVVLSKSSLTMSADGQIMVEDTWNPKDPNVRQRMFYNRQ
jgi:hypothetical protein